MGEPVPVEPQVLELLILLIENRDRVLNKDEIFQQIWKNRIVSDTTLSSRIKTARQAIGDSGAAQKYIRTIHGRGFRFVGEVNSGFTEKAVPPESATPSARPETRYAKIDDIHVAYHLFGEGPVNLVLMPGFVSHIDNYWDSPHLAHCLNRLGEMARVAMFDKRGTGLSDPVNNLPDMIERIADVQAVMDAAGFEQAIIMGISEGGSLGALFAAQYPERTQALILYGAYAQFSSWFVDTAALQELFDYIENDWGSGKSVPKFAPSMADDPEFRTWWGKFERLGATPGTAIALMRMNSQIDVSHCLAEIQAPTLVIHRTEDVLIDVEGGRYLADHIPNSRYLELPGKDHLMWVGANSDQIFDAIESFINRLLRFSDTARSSDGPYPSAVAPQIPEQRPITILSLLLANQSTNDESPAFAKLIEQSVKQQAGCIIEQSAQHLLAAFGIPHARHDDAQRAVKAAEAIQSSLFLQPQEHQLQVQMGIASGTTMAFQNSAAQWLLTGSVVNQASALAAQAAIGACWLNDRAYRAAALDQQAEPVTEDPPVWCLRHQSSSKPTDKPLIGRHAELSLFRSICAHCLEAQRGQTLLLRGEPGIGKTRLAEAFDVIAQAQAFFCHRSRILDFGLATDRQPIANLARSLLQLTSASTDEQHHDAFQAYMSNCGLNHDNGYLQIFLHDLLELPQPEDLRPLIDSMRPAERRRGRRQILADLLLQKARQCPQLLIVEDIHWADPTTLEDIRAIAQAVNQCTAVLVMTLRTDEPLDLQDLAVVSLELMPLQPDEAIQLATQLGFSNTALLQSCIDRSDGNPLFLEQLLYADATAGDIPESLQSLVWQRLDGLSASDKQAAQTAAVLGQVFMPDILHRLLESSDYQVDELIHRRLLRPAGAHLQFVHALIMEGIYSTLALAQRQRLHRRAAQCYQTQDRLLCAEHLAKAEDANAAQTYWEAAQEQVKAYRFEAALDTIQKGLALAHAAPTRFALQLLQAETQRDAGLVEQAASSYQQALDAASSLSEHCRAWTGLALNLHLQDRYNDALQALHNAETMAQDWPKDLAQIHYQRGRMLFPLGRIEECLASHRNALQYAQHAKSPELQARALSGLGDAYYQRGQMLTAQPYFDQALQLCQQHDLCHIEGVNLAMSGLCWFYKNQTDKARQMLQQAIDTALAARNSRDEMIARIVMAPIFGYAAEWGALYQQAELTLKLSRRLRSKRFEQGSLAFMGWALAAQGKLREGQTLIQQGYQISRETEPGYIGAWILGMLATASDDAAEQSQALSEGETLLRTSSVSHGYLHFYQLSIDVALAQKNWSEATRFASALEEYTQNEPLPWSDFYIARGRALAAFGSGQYTKQLLADLNELCEKARCYGLHSARPALKVALSEARRNTKSSRLTPSKTQ